VDEIHKLLVTCPEYLRRIVVCAINTGMRRGEILGLKCGQVRNGFIYLEKTKTNEYRQIFGFRKNGQSRNYLILLVGARGFDLRPLEPHSDYNPLYNLPIIHKILFLFVISRIHNIIKTIKKINTRHKFVTKERKNAKFAIGNGT
jgi:integrase